MSSTIIYSAFDFDIGLIIFYNSEGMIAVVNLYTMVRKFIQLGFQGHIFNIIIVERKNQDSNHYQVKKAMNPNCNLASSLYYDQ